MTGMQVALLDADEHVFSAEERQLVVEVLSGAEGQVRGLLRGLPERLNVAVYPTDFVIPEVGSGGVTPDKDLIELSVDPGHPGGVVSVVRGSFRTTLFHEAHHAARAHLLTAKWSPTEVHEGSCGEIVKAALEVTTGEAPSEGSSPCA